MQNNAYRDISDGGIVLLSGSSASTDPRELGNYLEYFRTALLSLHSGLSYLREPIQDGFEYKLLT